MSQPARANDAHQSDRVALVTGTGRRLGAVIAAALHAAGFRVVLHHHRSTANTLALADTLNAQRRQSARAVQADLREPATPAKLVADAGAVWGQLDVLVNNAAVFFATPLANTTLDHWDEMMGVNLKAPYFLSQAAAALLRETRGCIVNLTDIYADRPRADYAIYCASKAGLIGLTRALACDLAPSVRVNAVSPGAILWGETATATEQATILARTPLERTGDPTDICRAISYLIDAPYVTGQVLTVDGGRAIFEV
ncbi:MAG: pteridine reductase [Gammaproteobacteria bacterium]